MEVEADPYNLLLEHEGLIPTCWLLSGFISPEIYRETDVWNPRLSIVSLEQSVIHGNSNIVFFLLLAVLQRSSEAILDCHTVSEAEECIRILPWQVETEDVMTILDTALAMEKITPISVLQCLECVESQCASDLLPDAIPGSKEMWERRFGQFHTHMLLSGDDSLLQDFTRFSGIEGYMDSYLLQKTGVYRVLSREIAYFPYPTLSSLQGGASLVF